MPRNRSGCLTCREKHLKCDEAKPLCARCRKSSRRCTWDDVIKFRSSQRVAARAKLHASEERSSVATVFSPDSENVFSRDHCWLETPSRLSFVDETAVVSAQYLHNQALEDQALEDQALEDQALEHQALESHGSDAVNVSEANGTCDITLDTHESLFEPDSVASPPPAALPAHPVFPGRSTPPPPSIHTRTESFAIPDPPRRGSYVSPYQGSDYLAGFSLSPGSVANVFSPGATGFTPVVTGLTPVSHSSEDSRQVAPTNVSETISTGERHDGASPQYHRSPMVLGESGALQLYKDRMPLPFKVPQEALFFHHFLENLAGMLDMTDIQRHFAVDVPERALSCPVLLDALMAFAGRHLSRTSASESDSAIADHYHYHCVSRMIPMLNEKELVADETLFAAAVILRTYEETNETHMGAGLERHLTGTSVFANAQLEFHTWGGLGHAAFWVFVRQDIYMSLLSQQPLKVDLAGWEERLSFDLGFDPTTDCTWANRMIWIVAEIVGFCFGDRNTSNWESARDKVETWDLSRPKSFDPILYVERDPDAKRYFPEIRLGHPWHVTGIQYYYMAKLLLATCYPHVPKIGLGYQRAQRTMCDEILRNAEAVCGIAFATSLPAARLTACTAIIACGPWFVHRPREEQEQVLELLRRAEAESAYPTGSLARGLREEWEW